VSAMFGMVLSVLFSGGVKKNEGAEKWKWRTI
jgi:hypothetical protein